MINSNVPLDFTIGEDGQPRWKQRGADTWNPFKSSSGASLDNTTLVFSSFLYDTASYIVQKAGSYLVVAYGHNWDSSSSSTSSTASISLSDSSVKLVTLADNIRGGDTKKSSGGGSITIKYIPSCTLNTKITIYAVWSGVGLILKLG